MDSVMYLGIFDFIEHKYLTQTHKNTCEKTLCLIAYAFKGERKATDPSVNSIFIENNGQFWTTILS